MRNCLLIPFVLLSLPCLSTKLLAAEAKPDLRAKVDHAFDRLAFGARPGEREEVIKMGEAGLQNWIKLQLNPDSIDDSAVDSLLAKHEILSLSSEELMSQYMNEKQKANSPDTMDTDKRPDDIRRAWISAKIIRAVLSRKQLQEKLVDFWYNHFNVDQKKGKDRWLFGPYERDAIRPHINGRFVDLLRATARHPAMLFFLDNHLSRVEDQRRPNNKGGLNENYGRELMELHTLGVNGGYTQHDVTDAARILTGWTISDLNMQPAFAFKPNWHDTNAKKVMGWDFPAGGGEEEGEKLLQLLAESPATAKHISTQLIENFVANPAPPALVDRLQKVFLQTHGDLRSVYAELFNSQEFWDKKYYGQLIKDHFQWVVSVIRTLGGEVIWNHKLMGEFQNLGEPLYQCAPPTGYRLRPEDFINAGSLIQRLNLALRLSANRIDGVYISGLKTDGAHLKTPDDLIHELMRGVGLVSISESSRNALVNEVTGETWHLNNGETRPFILSRLLGLLLASPEFQRM